MFFQTSAISLTHPRLLHGGFRLQQYYQIITNATQLLVKYSSFSLHTGSLRHSKGANTGTQFSGKEKNAINIEDNT